MYLNYTNKIRGKTILLIKFVTDHFGLFNSKEVNTTPSMDFNSPTNFRRQSVITLKKSEVVAVLKIGSVIFLKLCICNIHGNPNIFISGKKPSS